MSMRWDPLLAAAAARELDDRLRNSRVRALLLDAESRRALLFLRSHTLVFELHPLRGWISLLPAIPPPEGARPLPARIGRVEALPDDSALIVSLPRIRGRDEGLELALEMVGNRWNAAAFGHRSRVIRHVLLARDSGARSFTVGSTWEPPQSTGRRGWAGDLTAEEWQEILEPAGSDPSARRTAILRTVAWTSSLNVDPLTGADGWKRWRRMIDPGSWTGCVLRTERGPQPYPVHPEGAEAEAFPTLLDAFSEARRRDPETEPAPALLSPPDLVARLEKRLVRARGKVRGLRRELDNARDPTAIRARGDLILARYAQVPRGAESVHLTGFDGEPVEMKLDPTLPPDANAARYYDEAARMERARDELPNRIEAAQQEVERWSAALERVYSGDSDPGELSAALGPVSRGEGQKGGARSEPGLPYRRFRSSGGLEIRVGRGARSNDDLTFHHSSPEDIWLHARQASGAHVILRWGQDGNPPRRDLGEAAGLAALHSQARHSGSVPVGWTRRKYVRKPRKAPPGSVVPDRMETVFVRPDPELIDRLAADGN